MTTKQPDYHEEQFLRRVFDTLYALRLQPVIDHWRDLSARSRILGIVSVLTLILVWVSVQLITTVVARAEAAALPTLTERLESPYAIEARLSPQLIESQLIMPVQVGYTPIAIEASVVNPTYACMVYGAGEVCNEGQLYPYTTYVEAFTFIDPNTTNFEEQIIAYEAELALYQTAYAEEEARLIEIAMAEALVQAEADAIASATEFDASQVVINPADLVIPEVVIDMAEPIMPELDLMPEIHVVMTQFDTQASARAAIDALYDTSRNTGRIGNFVFNEDMLVNYYYSISDGWRSFTWVHNNWVYTVSSTSFTTMEDVIETFPY